jgi:hypothetical protein
MLLTKSCYVLTSFGFLNRKLHGSFSLLLFELRDDRVDFVLAPNERRRRAADFPDLFLDFPRVDLTIEEVRRTRELVSRLQLELLFSRINS